MIHVLEELCSGCGTCSETCPVEAIELKKGKAHIDDALCTGCGLCIDACPQDAIKELSVDSQETSTPYSSSLHRRFLSPKRGNRHRRRWR